MKERQEMVDLEAQHLSIRRQCELLKVTRSSLNYTPVPTAAEELELMRRLDELHLRYPFYGSRKLAFELKREGLDANRKRIQRLMRTMGLESLAPKPNTSKPHPVHVKYPYLLRGLRIERANQVWASDITYIPMKSGFVYLVAIIDWYTRRVLSWRLSNTMEGGFCVDALLEALDLHGSPEIFNTDQGAQFTAAAFTGALLSRGIAVSMDGKGCCLDNVFVERLWRSVKYEEVYLHAYESMGEAQTRIGHYMRYFNSERAHQALGYQTPEKFYQGEQQRRAA
jgi:putative transposase